ncbi:MAG: NAD(P)-binding protein, partial [candidate division WOR-3 bacterium]
MRLIICHCNGLINIPDLDLGPDVKIERYDDLCKQEVKIDPGEKVVIGGCSPSLMEGLFPDADVEFVNLKDHIFLMNHSVEKAQSLLKAAIEKSKSGMGLKKKIFTIRSKSTAVIGSGVAGLDLTNALTKAGRKIYLIEKEPFLGGTVA